MPCGLVPQFALVFGPRELLDGGKILREVQSALPGTRLLVASTCGDITGIEITDEYIVVTAVAMEKTVVDFATVTVGERSESRRAGNELARALARPGLTHVFVLADGRIVNGTQLACGLNETLPAHVTVSGGLAGDGTRFERTLVGLDGDIGVGRLAAVAFYGDALRVAYGSSGGWVPFGPERIVTRSEDHVLFELDGQPALRFYRNYLGAAVADLPASALRFPLLMTCPNTAAVVRTAHSIQEEAGSMGFAGDIAVGARMRFLRASYEDLIDGGGRAAEQTLANPAPELAICVTCIGRRIVLGQRAEEEIEVVREALGPSTPIAGFYSYGELAPVGGSTGCQFHNQTMTITTLRED